jgi:predicted HicB family RNase H-like nuclease
MPNPHGGPRPGAGRPPTGKPRKIKMSIAIDPELVQWAEDEAARGGTSRNNVIEEAIRARRDAAGKRD